MSITRAFGINVNSDGGVSSTDKFTGAINRADAATGGFASKLGILDGKVGAAAVGIGAFTTAAVLATKKYNEFETSLAEVNTLLGDHQSIKDYSSSIRELAVEFGSDAPSQAAATYQIVSAGAKDAAEATDILTAANKLAVGGVTDILTASDGLTTILNAYNFEASSAGAVSDVLFSTMKSGKTTVGELSSSLGLIVPTAAQLGVSFPEVTAAIATLTTNGVATAQAVTQVNAALTSVLKPSKQASELADELGLNFNAQALEAQGLAGFLDTVAIATEGDATQLTKLFGSAEAVRALLPLVGGSAEKFTEILEANENAAGSTTAAYDVMAATTGKNFDRLVASVNELALTFGEDLSPVVNLGIDTLEGIVQTTQMTYDGISLLANIIGGELLESFQAWNNLIFGGAFETLNSQVEDTTGIFDVLSGVFSDTELVGIALVRGLLLGWEELDYGTKVILASIGGGFDKVFGEIGDEAKELITSIANAMDQLPEMFGVSGDSLRGFAAEIRTSTDAADSYDKKMQEIEEQHGLAKKSIIAITDDMADYTIELKQNSAEQSTLKTKTSETTAKTETHKGAVGEVKTATQLFNEQLVEEAKLLNQLQPVLVSTTTATYGLDDASTTIQRTLSENEKAVLATNAVLERANELHAQGKITTEEHALIIEQFGVTNGEVSDDVAILWGQTYEELEGSLAGFIEYGLSDWDGFTDSLEDMFIDMVKNMVAAWLASGIIGLLNGEGFDGFNTEAFLGGSGFDLGSLGGGSSTTTDANGNQVPRTNSNGEETNAFGLTEDQVQGGLDAIEGLTNIYGGYQNIQNGNEVQGVIQVVDGGIGTYEGYQQFTGGDGTVSPYLTGGVQAATGALDIYGGYQSIKNGNYFEGGLQIAGGGLDIYNGYQTATGGELASGAFGSGLGVAGSAYGLYNSIDNGDYLGAAINGYQLYQSGTALYGALAGGSTATGAGIAGGAATGTAAAGSAFATATGWGAIALAADQWLNDGKIGEEGFKVWDQRKADVRSGAFGVEKGILNEGANLLDFIGGIFGAPGEEGLGYEQLEKLGKQLENGEKQSYDLGASANLVGAFNSETTFFENKVAGVDNERVTDLLKNEFGFERATELGDSGILRLEDKSRDFFAESEAMTTEVLTAIASIQTGFSQAEVDILTGMGEMVTTMDANWDATAESGLETAERVKLAYMDTYGASIEEADAWLENSEITAERYAEIFDASTGQVLQGVIDLGVQVETTFGTISENTGKSAGTISGEFEDVFNGLGDNLEATTAVAEAEAALLESLYTFSAHGISEEFTEASNTAREALLLMSETGDEEAKKLAGEYITQLDTMANSSQDSFAQMSKYGGATIEELTAKYSNFAGDITQYLGSSTTTLQTYFADIEKTAAESAASAFDSFQSLDGINVNAFVNVSETGDIRGAQGIPAYMDGTPEILNDGYAYLHKGEMVINPSSAKALRENGIDVNVQSDEIRSDDLRGSTARLNTEQDNAMLIKSVDSLVQQLKTQSKFSRANNQRGGV